MRTRGLATFEVKSGIDDVVDNPMLTPCTDDQVVAEGTVPGKDAREMAMDIIGRISFQKHVGCIGKILLLLMLFVSLLLAAIFYKYANVFGRSDFQRINTPFVWIFLLSSVIYVGRIVHKLLTWRNDAINYVRDLYGLHAYNNRKRSFFRQLKDYYDARFNINGKFYLYVLFGGEFVSCYMQFYNLINVYFCSLPMGWNIIFMIIFAFESAHRAFIVFFKAYGKKSIISINERNQFIILDVALNLAFLVVPPAIIFLVHQLQISVTESLQIIIVPAMLLLNKIPTVLQHNTYNIILSEIVVEEPKKPRSARQRGKELSFQATNQRIEKQQNKQFPRYVKAVVFWNSLLYAVALTAIIVRQAWFLIDPNECENTFNNTNLWTECQIKVPFCKRLLEPKCNCAYLLIKNDPVLVRLPNNVATEMSGLRYVRIEHCNLKFLPPNLERLTEMVDFRVTFNKLAEFNVDIRAWTKLLTLYLFNNNIKEHNWKALWSHPNIQAIDFGNNSGFGMPNVEMHLPYLQYLNVENNGMTLDIDIRKEFFPNLLYLYVSGNNLAKFPHSSIGSRLLYLGIARCNVKSLPSYLSEFSKLKYFDARDNNITFVGNKVKALIKKNGVESYFAGNPVCHNDMSLDCKPLCSQLCWSRDEPGNNYCDFKCNAEKCNFDGGDCM